MTPTKPYFIRALYDWIVDNNLTPYLLVDAQHEKCVVPRQFVRDGMIVLNLAPAAIRSLELGLEYVLFNARFGGVAQDVTVPVTAVKAIYAKENGKGLAFEDNQESDNAATAAPAPPSSVAALPRKGPPKLTIVK